MKSLRKTAFLFMATLSIASAETPPPAITSAEALEAKAQATIIPKLVFKEVSSSEALMMISTMTGIKILAVPAAPDKTLITVSLSNIPASEALKYVTGLANLKFRYEKDGVRVVPMTADLPAPK